MEISPEGGVGPSFAKKMQMALEAVVLSIKIAGTVEEFEVGGAISAVGDVVAVELSDLVGSWDVSCGIRASGGNSDGYNVPDPVPSFRACPTLQPTARMSSS